MIEQFDIWIADLNPQVGTETGKVRPVLVIQTDLLNSIAHPSTIILPITSKLKHKAKFLRVALPKGQGNIERDSEIVIDQIRSIDNSRLISRIGALPDQFVQQVKYNISILLD